MSCAGAADFSRFAAAGAMSPAALGGCGAGSLGMGESPVLPPLRIGRVRGWAGRAGGGSGGGGADLGGCGSALAGADELCGALGLSDDVLRV